eukprot:jgi/Botrbrau1/11291/Bobra.0038s0057.1
MKGRWSGAVQAYGGGGGATNVDFNLRGQDWGWGAYCIDQVVAVGSSHSDEGLHLEEVTLKTGEAKLAMQGSLLGARQDASLLVTDFPVALLRPLFRSLPALDHVPPALPPGGGGTAMTSSSLWRVIRRNHLASDNLTSSSPIRGQLFHQRPHRGERSGTGGGAESGAVRCRHRHDDPGAGSGQSSFRQGAAPPVQR